MFGLFSSKQHPKMGLYKESPNLSDKMMIIAGAGPTGLAAALFLTEFGIKAKIYEQALHPCPWSRALGVNPRTLDILEPTGVTDELLKRGLQVKQFEMHGSDNKSLVKFQIPEGIHKYSFLLLLSQAVMEEVLTNALKEKGVSVIRGKKLITCRQRIGADDKDNKVVAEFQSVSTGNRETVVGDWLLGADGSRSAVRESLGLSFDGDRFPNKIYLVDIPLKCALDQHCGHPMFLPHGDFLFMIRMVEDIRKEGSGDTQVWRLISNIEDPLPLLPKGATVAGPAVWSSGFVISHRVASQFAVGNIFLAGDAAHVHSPIGARGMNLGIEDAFKLAQYIGQAEESRYGSERIKTDSVVVRHVRRVTSVIMGRSYLSRFLRRYVLPFALKYCSWARSQFFKFGFGLDHPL